MKAISPRLSALGLMLGVWIGGSACGACAGTAVGSNPKQAPEGGAPDGSGLTRAKLPLVLVSDDALPGGSTRFDYQDIDTATGRLIIAHMNDNAVVVVDLKDGAVLKELKGIPTARGVVAAGDVGLVFVTSSPNQLVLIDDKSLTEIKRVATGRGPDGVAWDDAHKMVGVSDQGDGALSIIADSGSGARTQVPLGTATGNVVYDSVRRWFWVTVESSSPPDKLVAVDPTSAKVAASMGLPGCNAAHGLRLHPNGQSAFIACEGNNVLARVDLGGDHAVTTAKTGDGPDVLAIDPGLGWLYVAAESGDVTVFDINQPGLELLGHEQPGANAHSVAVDPRTHRVFFPLLAGANGKPVLRIMQPTF